MVVEIFTCLSWTDRQTNRRTNHYHIRVGKTFLLFEKITFPTHYANFASLICFVRRGIRLFAWIRSSLLVKIQWRLHNYIDVVLFGSCRHMIMMTLKVDPLAERGARMRNRDRMSFIKNSNDIICKTRFLSIFDTDMELGIKTLGLPMY